MTRLQSTMSAPSPSPHHHHRHHFLTVDDMFSSNSALLVAAITFLLLVLLFVLLLHIYARCFLLPRTSSPVPPLPTLRASGTPPPHQGSSLSPAGDPPSPTKGGGGLDFSTIASIPLFAYGGGAPGSLECVVCLNAFRDGDVGRALTTCAHRAFHVHCIDTWLLSHPTCPVCRAPVTASPLLAGIDPPAVLGEEEEEGSSVVIEITDSNENENEERDRDLVLSLQESPSMGRSLRRVMSRNHRSDRKIHPSSSSSAQRDDS